MYIYSYEVTYLITFKHNKSDFSKPRFYLRRVVPLYT